MTLPEALQLMLNQLESHQLRVELAPLNPRLRNYNEGGCKRVVVDANPIWYRRFCGRHLSSRKRNHRKPDTKIKRANTLRALNQLIRGVPAGKYGEEPVGIARGVARAA